MHVYIHPIIFQSVVSNASKLASFRGSSCQDIYKSSFKFVFICEPILIFDQLEKSACVSQKTSREKRN